MSLKEARIKEQAGDVDTRVLPPYYMEANCTIFYCYVTIPPN